MTVPSVANTPPTPEIIKAREKRGECITCGQKCYSRSAFKSVPLTLDGAVLNGRCLLCNPLNAIPNSAPTNEEPDKPGTFPDFTGKEIIAHGGSVAESLLTDDKEYFARESTAPSKYKPFVIEEDDENHHTTDVSFSSQGKKVNAVTGSQAENAIQSSSMNDSKSSHQKIHTALPITSDNGETQKSHNLEKGEGTSKGNTTVILTSTTSQEQKFNALPPSPSSNDRRPSHFKKILVSSVVICVLITIIVLAMTLTQSNEPPPTAPSSSNVPDSQVTDPMPGSTELSIEVPTMNPTYNPTNSPMMQEMSSKTPTLYRTKNPTNVPSKSPTKNPTSAPTESPTSPIELPMKPAPETPTNLPTESPLTNPTINSAPEETTCVKCDRLDGN